MNQLFASRGQSIGASVSASVLPMNTHDWFHIGLTGLISLQSKWLSRIFSSIQFESISYLALNLLYSSTLTCTWLLEKIIALTIQTFVGKVKSLLLNMLSKFVIDFLPRSKRLLISWLQWQSSVILEPKKMKSVNFSPSICHEVVGLGAMIWVFWTLSFKSAFSFSSFTLIEMLFIFTSYH